MHVAHACVAARPSIYTRASAHFLSPSKHKILRICCVRCACCGRNELHSLDVFPYLLRRAGGGAEVLWEGSEDLAGTVSSFCAGRRPIWHVFKPQGCLVYYTSSYVSSRSISTQCAPAVLSPAGMDPQPDGAGSLCGAGPYRRGSHAHVLADDRYNMHPAHAYACHACSWSRHNRLCSSSRGACGEFLAAIPGAGSMLGDDEFVDSLQRSHRPPQGHRSTSPWPRKNTTARTKHRKNQPPQGNRSWHARSFCASLYDIDGLQGGTR